METKQSTCRREIFQDLSQSTSTIHLKWIQLNWLINLYINNERKYNIDFIEFFFFTIIANVRELTLS